MQGYYHKRLSSHNYNMSPSSTRIFLVSGFYDILSVEVLKELHHHAGSLSFFSQCHIQMSNVPSLHDWVQIYTLCFEPSFSRQGQVVFSAPPLQPYPPFF